MRKLTQILLWLLVFSVPAGIDSSIPGIGTITRLLGMFTVGIGLMTAMVEGRTRKLDSIIWSAAAFAIFSVLSLMWTISFPLTYERAGTVIQFVGLIWLVREFARTHEEQHALRIAFCLGGLMFAFEVLRNFSGDLQVEGSGGRYSVTGINPNFVGFVMVSGLPMAWQLFLQRGGFTRLLSAIYCTVAPLVVILSASRSAFIALLITVAVVPFTIWKRRALRLKVAGGSLAVVFLVGIIVPQYSWNRLLTIEEELGGDTGTIGARSQIWAAGLPFVQERPLLGAGAGTFPVVVEPVVESQKAAHNTPLSLLVEQGVAGVFLFAALLAACARTILRLPSPDRELGIAWMVAWFVFAMSHDSHTDRVTWVVFALLAAQERVRVRRSVSSPVTFDPRALGAGSIPVAVPPAVSTYR